MRAQEGVRGFTLLEVIVSLVIVVAAVAVIAQGFSAGSQAAYFAEAETTATMLASEKMAQVETGEISLTTGDRGTFQDHEQFRYEVTVTSTTTGLYEVKVEVFYTDGFEERSIALHRLMRERPKAE